MLTDIDYDELTDDYYGVCLVPGCGWTGPGRMRRRDADIDADRHEDRHDDGVI
jgi:hypothetical protein